MVEVDGPAVSHSYEELRADPSDDELVRAHDQLAKSTVVGTVYFLAELERRERDRQAAQMAEYTRKVTRLTWVIAALTLVNAVAACVAAF